MFFIFLCCSVLDEDEQKRISELYENLMPTLVRYAYTKVIDQSCAEDIVQSAFIILIDKYKELNSDNLYLWMVRVVENLIKNKNRSDKRTINTIIDIDSLREKEIFCDEQTSYVKDILVIELSETEMDFFNTYFVLQVPHEKAARKYNISINASKVRKTRIRAKVIRVLQENGITLRKVCSNE